MNIGLGIPPQEPNPFVFTGLPKVGQVWKYKYSDRPYLQILKVDFYWYRVTYRCLCGQDNCGLATTVSIPEFQNKFVFSH